MDARGHDRRSKAWIIVPPVAVVASLAGIVWLQPEWFARALDLRGDRGAISGMVSDERGAAAGAAALTLFPLARPGGTCGFGTFADDQGRFLLRGLEPGEPGFLIVNAEGFAEYMRLDVRGGDRGVRVLLAPPAPLRGRFRIPDGNSGADFGLDVRPTDSRRPGLRPHSAKSLDDDGAFAFENLAAGEYEISVHRSREPGFGAGLRMTVLLREGQTTDLGVLELPTLSPSSTGSTEHAWR